MRKLVISFLLVTSLQAQYLINPHRYLPLGAATPPPISFGVASVTGVTAGDGLGGNGDLTTTLPTSWAAGQVAFLAIYTDQGDASTPTNWSEVTGSPFGTATPKLCIFYKVLWSADVNPVSTISGSTGTLASLGAIVTYNNVDTVNIFDIVGNDSAGTGANVRTYSITTTYDSSWVVTFMGRGDNEATGSQTYGGSGTDVNERTDHGDNAGDDAELCVWDKPMLADGATGESAGTTSATDPWVAVSIGIRRRAY